MPEHAPDDADPVGNPPDWLPVGPAHRLIVRMMLWRLR